MTNKNKLKIVNLTTNVSQIFTELYERYDILVTDPINVFENSLYLENLQSQSIKQRMSDALIEYHKDEGTLDLYIDPSVALEDQVFIAACGSTQLYKGLVYAMATSFPEDEFLFVQRIPYFSGHQSAVETVFPYQNATYLGYDDPEEVPHDPGVYIVEFVTSPNNPDGSFRKPETDPDIIIGDFVFTSSAFGSDGTGYLQRNLKWLKRARNKGKTIFSYNSASKQFGKTGDRMGYMWFPMNDSFASEIFSQLNNFIAITVGATLKGASNFLDLLPSLMKVGVSLRRDANDSLKKRLKILSKAIMKRYPGSNIQTFPGSPTLFAKINDPRISVQTAANIVFEDTRTQVENGKAFGSTDAFIRVNIMAFNEDLSRFANRLVDQKRYHRQEFLISQRKRSKCIIVCGISKKKVIRLAEPGNKCIKVDASKGNVTIILPKFLGYEESMKINVKRVDNSLHKVLIRSDFFRVSVKRYEIITFIWTQPFYENGTWKVIGEKRKKREYYGSTKQICPYMTDKIQKMFLV
uniref:Allinase n=1 Tax=Pithovirus LCPAC404 TaxID=2506597 RepID=A0A481ZEH5_9VIRU|nr:MAG: allinase [Pithovirus LCPAC404]